MYNWLPSFKNKINTKKNILYVELAQAVRAMDLAALSNEDLWVHLTLVLVEVQSRLPVGGGRPPLPGGPLTPGRVS